MKDVCRYPQYRAVQRAIDGLLHRPTRAVDGEHDRRGGIVWHTQGSGKSLTMVFLIRKMRSEPDLRAFKIVVVTDRTQLEDQLAATARLTDEPLTRVVSERRGLRTVSAVDVLQETLRRPGKDLVFAMIQKYRGPSPDADDEETTGDGAVEDPPGALPVLNEDEKILVIVDEAHRSHTNTLHANLMRALPNCARIGFTGTPILMGAKKYTDEIFGDFIDRYLLRESEEDGATLPIVYEGRTADAAVRGGSRLDGVFDDMFRFRTPAEIIALQARYATRGDVLEAPALIAQKARDMLRHYVDNALPNGFKAQVVAVSRRAAIRYREAFLVARHEIVARLAALDPAWLTAPESTDPETAFLVRAHRLLPLLRAMDFAVVISAGGKKVDDPTWREWTEPAKAQDRIALFQKPFVLADEKTHRLPAMLIVKSMLLTGFDAPVEQALYLDRRMEGAELLQAIARVNRTYGDQKRAGMVVDYFGVTAHLQEALSVYNAADVVGALRSLKQEEIDRLGERRDAVLEVLATNGPGDLSDEATCIAVLADPRVRRDFHERLKSFLAALDLVLPRPEALPYVADAKALAFLQARVRNRYRSGRLIGAEVGAKVRRLIDDHIVSRGVDVTIPPISLTDPRFFEHLSHEMTPRERAGELEQALRGHIDEHRDEDPGHYEKLSQRLASILDEFEDRWEALAEALERLAEEVRAGRGADETGLDPAVYGPFLDVLRTEGEVPEAELPALARTLVDLICKHLGRVEFWETTDAQERLRKRIIKFLDRGWNDREIIAFEKQTAASHRLMELARRNQAKLVGAP